MGLKMGLVTPFSGSWVAHGWLMVGSWLDLRRWLEAGGLCSLGNFFLRSVSGRSLLLASTAGD